MAATIVEGMPTQASSNISSPGRPSFTSTPLTTRLVLVPIKVQTPPSTEAYDSGIKNFDAGRRILRARPMTTGTNTTTTGVLLIHAETKATTSTRTNNTNW